MKPHPYTPPTREEIDAARTPGGGWTKATLASWGCRWPPPRGWRKAMLEGRHPHDTDLRRRTKP